MEVGALGKSSGKLAICSGVRGAVVDLLVSLRPPRRLDLVVLENGLVGVFVVILPLTFQPILMSPSAML